MNFERRKENGAATKGLNGKRKMKRVQRKWAAMEAMSGDASIEEVDGAAGNGLQDYKQTGHKQSDLWRRTDGL